MIIFAFFAEKNNKTTLILFEVIFCRKAPSRLLFSAFFYLISSREKSGRLLLALSHFSTRFCSRTDDRLTLSISRDLSPSLASERSWVIKRVLKELLTLRSLHFACSLVCSSRRESVRNEEVECENIRLRSLSLFNLAHCTQRGQWVRNFAQNSRTR